VISLPRPSRPRAPVGKCRAKKYSDEPSGATRISAVTVIDYFGLITNSLFGLDKIMVEDFAIIGPIPAYQFVRFKEMSVLFLMKCGTVDTRVRATE
jgi:hypothetical protein